MSYYLSLGITTRLTIQKEQVLKSFQDLDFVVNYVQTNFNSTNLYDVNEDEAKIEWTLKRDIFDDEIVDFSELSGFLDVPVKNFSSGMVARLGFSIATIVKAEVLIVDEVLSVGDESFQKKCEKKMESLLSDGTTLIFVSHSSDQVKRLCRKAIWLDKGEVQMQGDSETVCSAYQSFLNPELAK